MNADEFLVGDPDARDVMVRRLVEQRTAAGRYPAGAVQRVADVCGVHRSVVYRWCEKGTSRRKSRSAWLLDDAARAAIIEAAGNVALARDLQLGRGIEMKSRATCYRAVQRENDTALIEYARLGAHAVMARRIALFAPRDGPNERWEMDHSGLPIEVLLKPGDRSPVKMQITAVVDCDNGEILSQVLSYPAPTRGHVLCALRLAIERYGIPNVVACDNGLTFTSRAVRQVAAMLDFRVVPLLPHSPDDKGSIERTFRTIKTRFCPLQPFYTRGARRKDRTLYGQEASRLDTEALARRLSQFVDAHNTQVKVRHLGGRTRAQARAERAGPLRWASEEDLRTLTLERRRCRIRHDGGIWIDNVAFIDDEGKLQKKTGRTVTVGMMPNDYSRIEVWLGGDWLCTATPTRKISPEGREANRRSQAAANLELGRLRRLATAQRDRFAPITPDEPIPRPIGRSAIEPISMEETQTRDPLGFGTEIGQVI